MSLTKDQILRADDLPREQVDVPEWGGSVFVRTMTGAERDAFEQSIVEDSGRNLANLRARLAVLTVVDADGARLFADSDAMVLGGKSAAALSRVFNVAQRLNALTNSDVEELGKNSAAGQSADSTSA